MRRKESCAFWPSRVLVCSHSSPLAIRSAPGLAITPYLPGIILATTIWPASGDRIGLPAESVPVSYFGQVTITPVIPAVCDGIGLPLLSSGTGPSAALVPGLLTPICVIGQAFKPVAGSTVPSRL